MEFYRDLFSHKDRPSKTKLDLIDSKVSYYQEQIQTKIYDFKFKGHELENCIKSLKINKSPGHDSIVFETINYHKYGKSNTHIVSLDASNAFPKLWRLTNGLFSSTKLIVRFGELFLTIIKNLNS